MFSMRGKVFLIIIVNICVASFAANSKTGCSDKCGNITIPYPFGTTDDCSRPGFFINCNETYQPPLAFLGHHGNLQVIDIFLERAEVKVHHSISWRCFSSPNTIKSNFSVYTVLSNGTYLFSSTRNKFTAIGCNNLAYIWGANNKSYASGCLSYCGSIGSAKDGPCEGTGCCQTSIPKGLNYIETGWGSNLNYFYDSNPCIYATLVEQDWYNFNTTDLTGTEFFYNKTNKGRVPVVLDWAIRNGTCKQGSGNECISSNSECYSTTNGDGYLCNCSQGYEGNPYLAGGCRDINECHQSDKYPCHGRCENTPGNYKCECRRGQQAGNPKNEPCTDIIPVPAWWAIGICGAMVIIAAIIFVIILVLQKNKFENERKMNYRKNGGDELLRKLIETRVRGIDVFTEEDLKKITNNFDEEQIIGRGGRGNVYRGTLENGFEVAIKRSKEFSDDQKEEFANEIITLSQINHRHVVQLLGCCLEVKIPMLVYEYICNGTLYDFLHTRNRRRSSIPLGMRLKIAKQSAEALSTLHYSMNCRIIHGDIKSLNILLDDEFNAKVSDFGASSLVPLEGNQFVEFIQGTVGYLDPECFHTHELTEKSDVFSFGVVLLELITVKQAIYADENGEKKSLAKSFVTAMDENRLESILDDDVANETAIGVLHGVAVLALKCLNIKGEDRPTMKEVAESLQVLLNANPDLVYTFADHAEPAPINLLHEGTSDVTTNSAPFLSTLHIDAGR